LGFMRFSHCLPLLSSHELHCMRSWATPPGYSPGLVWPRRPLPRPSLRHPEPVEDLP